MCVRTKTTFGCGHWAKTTEPCGYSTCTTIDKWGIPAENKDCGQCRSGGTTANRGREGRGAHAKEIRKEQRRSSPQSTSTPSSPSAHLSISPWALERSSSQKKWDTPTRQKADAAWVVEHERRMSDIEETTSKLSIRSRRNSNSSPHTSYERIIEADEVEEPEELDFENIQPRVQRLLPFEVSRTSESSSSPRRSTKHSRSSDHHVSQHQQLVLKAPHRRTQHESPSSEYPEKHSYQQIIRKPRKTRTEPYYAQSCSFDPPVAIVPTHSPVPFEQWANPFDYVPQMQHDICYPRAYPVY